MKHSVNILVAAALLGSTGLTLASDLCSVPQDKWRPQEELQSKLESDGWSVQRIKIEDGCFEVYARNAEGKKVEAYINPETFELVKVKES